MIRRISLVLAAAALAIAAFTPFAGAVVLAQGATATLQFAFNSAGSGPILRLTGQNACSVTVASAGTGLNALTLKNSVDGGQTFSVNANVGSITTTGVYAGALAAGTTDVEPVVTALTTGPVTGTISCYVAASSGGGGGTYTAPPVQPVSPATGISPFPVQVSGPVAVSSLPPVTVASLPPVVISSQAPVAISSLPPVTLTGPLPQPASTLPVTTPAPQTSAAPGYVRVEDGTTTNLLVVDSSGRLSLAFPYTFALSGQAAQAASGVGVLGLYNSTVPTLTTGQAAPLQLTVNGALEGAVCSGAGTFLCANVLVPGDTLGSPYALSALGLNQAYNGVTWDRVRKDTYAPGPLWTTGGGATMTVLTSASPTTCTAIKPSAGRLAKFWSTGAASSVFLQIYNDNGTCAAADLIWGDGTSLGFPAASSPVTLDVPMSAGISYKLSGALTANAVITSF